MTIIEAVSDPKLFKKWFDGNTWASWQSFLKVLFALPLDDDDSITYQRHTRREIAPQEAFREAWVVVGRRGGKSLIAALVAVYLACFRDYSKYLQPGEVGTIAVIAADRRQARTVLRYIRGFLALPMLRPFVENDKQESIELNNRVVLEVHSANFRSTRGYSLLAVICDELAFWRNDESANPDREIISAVRPGLATIPNSLLLCISSPYARRGALWSTYQKHFGKDSPILVWQATSREMNPSLPESVVAQAIEEDPSSASAEYLAQFRSDVETFVSLEIVQAATVAGRIELPPSRSYEHVAFCDPSGGSSDSMTLAIAHTETQNSVSKFVLDAIRERTAPFSPDACVQEFVTVLKTYGLSKVIGDRYAGEWVRQSFRQHGVSYEPAERSKNEIYGELLPLLNSKRIELLDVPRLAAQLVGLERRTGTGGRDVIDHSPGAHDDVANAVAGALTLAAKRVSAGFYC